MSRQRTAIALAIVGLAAFALWRVRYGADFGDGSYMVTLAAQTAQGRMPLSDEASAHAFGSLPTVPLVAVWLPLFGTEGIVLASRIWFLLLAGAFGWVAYRGLRTGFAVLPSAFAVVLTLVPTPYGLWVATYNTTPSIALLLALSCGYAAWRTGSTRWGLGAGVAVALAPIGHPSLFPSALLICLTLIALLLAAHGRRIAGAVVVGGGVVSVVVLGWVLLVPGLDAVRQAVTANSVDQAYYIGTAERLSRATANYLDTITTWPVLLAIAIALLACWPRWSDRVRAGLLLAVPVVLTINAVATLVGPQPRIAGATAGSLALLTCLVLVVPVLVWALVGRRRDVLVLLALTVPAAAVGAVLLTSSTRATAYWAPQLPAAIPLYAVLLLAISTALVEAFAKAAWQAIAVGALAALLLVTQSLHTFRDDAPWTTEGPIASGPNAGLHTSACYVDFDRRLIDVVDRWTGPDDTLFVHGRPATYLYSEAEPATPILWFSIWGTENSAWVLDHLTSLPEPPSVILLDRGSVQNGGGWSTVRSEDPLGAWIADNYAPPIADGTFFVVVPSAPDPLPTGVNPDRPGC